MKHFKRHHLAILPLLSILSMSPGVVESHFADRQIASVVEDVKEVKGHPKLEVLVSKVDPKSLIKDRNLDMDKLKAKGEALLAKVSKEREDFKKDQSDKVVVEEQRKRVEAIVIDLLLVESAVKELDEKKVITAEDKTLAEKGLLIQRDVIESLLVDLEANEVLVAKASEPKVEEPKKEDKPVVAEEPKKEEPKTEEPKKEEEKPVVAEEPKKEEPKKEEAKKEVCEADEKNKVLTAQIEQLLKQQNQIMQTMMGMAQMMVSMHQQQQPNPYYANGPGMNVQNPYQYNQPFTAGNWVYMPNGFQPNQPNIFAQPMQQQQPQMQQYGIYPDQMHQQQQSNWNLQPDPRFQYQPQVPYGSFGNNGLSFNMQNMVPTISQG